MSAIPKSGRKASIAVVAVFVLLSCVARVRAVTFEDYRHQVSRAVATTHELQTAYKDQYPSQEFVAATIALLRTELPAHETVLLGRQSVTVDNTWLHEALNDYEKSSGDNARRVELLARIDERLRALGERLDEMQSGKPLASKDENKTRLAEILRRAEYNQQAEGGSALNRLLNRFLRWLLRLFPRTKPLQLVNAMVFSRIALVVVIVVILATIRFLIWNFSPPYLLNSQQMMT